MRHNLPVTGHEHVLSPETTLVSVTDPKGVIVYANPAFVEASGFAHDELVGQAHNIVRHPSVPAEAFRDLWDTVLSGRPWCGLVKNRRKNGDHYWVRANVTPMKSGGRFVGCLSVRTVPTRAEVEAAERLYAMLADEAAQGVPRHGLRGGRLRRVDRIGRAGQWLTGMPSRIGPAGALWFGTAATIAAAFTWLPVPAAVPAGIVMACAALAGFRRLESAPVRQALHDAMQLAAGDLMHPVQVGESGLVADLQRALAQMAVNLRSVVGGVRIEVLNLRGAAHGIAAGNQDLSVRTDAQAASLQQTAASMEQIQATVQQSAHSADEGLRLAGEAAEVAQRSQAGVLGVVQAMDAISESSRRIAEIVSVIEGVAFQTTMLALNAAVEAARAGEQGRGFAVVAAEVRALAQRTTGAAREIRQLIAESSERVQAGGEQTAAARERMQEVVGVVDRVGTLLRQIGVAAGEQRSGVTQVNEAVGGLDTITQRNASLVQELSVSAAMLAGQVQVVEDSLGVFRLHAGDRTLAEADVAGLRRAARQSRQARDATPA